MSELLTKTLSQIVSENYQAAPVFEKYGLDFCCRGKRPLQDAIADAFIPAEPLLKDLDEVLAKPDTNLDFNSMSLTELAEYIVRVHHGYTREQMPQTLAYVERVALKHGDRFPYMRDVYVLFSQLMQEMNEHMLKEEKILFPRIKLLELDPASVKGSDFMQGPIDIMEEDHELAGTTMRTIRQLTNNYTPAETACTTHRLAIASLQAFEVDLHQHVHLENNILFPKAIAKVRDSQKVY